MIPHPSVWYVFARPYRPHPRFAALGAVAFSALPTLFGEPPLAVALYTGGGLAAWTALSLLRMAYAGWRDWQAEWIRLDAFEWADEEDE